jgi:hydroxymethylglutaryl-CoA lyase
LRRIVVGSFVSARYTPQMAEIDALVERLTPREGVTYTAIALNERGRERRARHSPPLVPVNAAPALFCHLCDTFVRRNANSTQAQEIDAWPAIVADARERAVAEAGVGLGAAFGSNFEGPFSLEHGMRLLARQHALWDEAGIPVTAVYLYDPMGWCTPRQVGEQLVALLERWPRITHFHLHLHDSRGLALASTYEAIRVLDARHELHLDTTAGGIGGCPYCGNGRATGMVATEDLVNMLELMGIPTGVDLERLIRAVWLLEEIIGRPANGHVSKAGPHPSGERLYDPNLPLVETFAEARHFLLGPAVAKHQLRPWRTPIPAPAPHP